MAPILRNLLLLATIITPSFAVPTSESQGAVHHGTIVPASKSPFKRFRDFIIESIWDVPTKPKCQTTNIKTDHKASSNFRSKYGRDVVLRFKITTIDEAKAFSEAAGILYLDIWDHTSEWIDVRIAKEVLPSFLNLLPPSLRESHTPLMHDLAQSVYDTYPSTSHAESWRARHNPVQKHTANLYFQNYQPLSVIYPWLQLVAALFSNHAEYISIGKSAEGRDIPAIRIGAPPNEQLPNRGVNGRETILVVGGSHAREWISTSTVAYLAYQFATRYNSKNRVTKILKHFDIIFVPILNPDGYEYTWTNDRLWHKNRQATTIPFCPGIDIDRSYGYKWNGDNESDNPCTETYAGQHAFQAVEAKTLVDWAVNQTRDNNRVFTSYLDLHSYSQKVLYPYSYSCNASPHNLEDLMELALGMTKAFRTTSGHSYTVDSACRSEFLSTLEKEGNLKPDDDPSLDNAGSSLDYFYEMLRVTWAYQIRLRDTGTYGFLLPKDQIIPTGKEMYRALLDVGRFILSNRGIESVDDDDDAELEMVTTENVDASRDQQAWERRRPSTIFHVSDDKNDLATDGPNDKDEEDDEQWERVFDPELRRRR